MIGGSDTGVVAEAKLEGGTAEITEVADNIATLSGTNVPVGVRTNSGTYYPIEKGSVVIDITNGQIKLDVTPYLAYDNAASFTGPWTVYYAAGSKGDKGDNALSFQIGTVTTLAAALRRPLRLQSAMRDSSRSTSASRRGQTVRTVRMVLTEKMRMPQQPLMRTIPMHQHIPRFRISSPAISPLRAGR